MRKYLLLLLLSCTIHAVFSQDFSNKGKDFWLVFPAHVVSQGDARMGLFITSDKNSAGTITVGAFSTTFTVSANQVTGPIDIPYDIANIGTDNNVVNKGIRVKVDNGQPAVVLYAHIYAGFRSEASLILPVNTLGKKYFSSNFYQLSTGGSKSQFNIVATEANTVIHYQLRINGILDPTITTVSLPLAGDQIQVQNDNDLSGSIIESIASGTGGCKKIAVFSGSSAIGIGSNSCSPNSFDPLYQQCYPVSTWGKNFGVVPYQNNGNGFHLRVIASENNTTINVDGTSVLLNEGEYYPATNPNPTPFVAPLIVTADKPICVAQYMMSGRCAGTKPPPPDPNGTYQGDPEMIILNPVEQNINDINIFSSDLQAILTKYLNVYIKTSGAASFRINGGIPNAPFLPMPQNNGYSYLLEDLTPYLKNSFRLSADSGFNAISYGMGSAETYGYSAGTNVRDLYQQIGVSSQYGIETTPSVCVGSPFKFKISLPYQPDSMYWDLSPVHPPVWLKRVTPAQLPFDSTTTVNGVQIWWYSLPLTYSYATTGSFPITITTYKANSDGCGNEQEIDFDLEVSNTPIADFTAVATRCVAEPVQFNDASSTTKPTYRWWWDFKDPASGANNTSNLKNPIHLFTAPGTYRVRYANITTAGCLSDTIEHDVVIAALPTALANGNITVCQNAPSPNITFTGAGGSAPYTFTYNINGGATQTATTTTGNSISFLISTSVPGVIRYSLLSVQNSGSTLCRQLQNGFAEVTIRSLPSATLFGSASVCQNVPSPNVVFTGAGGVAPYTFTYNINGGATQTVTTVSGNSISLPVSTTTGGTFVYTLISVKEGSGFLCSAPVTGTAVVVVNPLPTATVSGSTEVCKNAASPSIVFTGAGGTAPYTFTYTLNGSPLTITTVTGSSISVPVSTAATGSFVYVLTSVKDASSTTCSQPVSGAAAIVKVNPLPAATLNGSTIICENAPSPNITFTGSGTIAPYTFTYTINGGAALTVTSTAGNIVQLAVPTSTPGSFVYKLVSVQDASATGCSGLVIGQVANITVRALPTASVGGSTTVCQNAAGPAVTFTGSGGNAPYIFTYTINGGATQTVSTIAGNFVTLTAPTAVAGSFVYTLLSVKESSSATCLATVSGQAATVTVHPLPTATLSGSGTVCLNALSPQILFTGAGGTAPYTFTYTLNGGPLQAVTSTAGNTASLVVPTTNSGTFTYTLVSVKDGNVTSCSQLQSGTAVVTVNALPVANYTFSTPTCETRQIDFNASASIANAGTITSWVWSFGDPSAGASNTSLIQNPSHIFSNPGTYSVNLKVTTDQGCVSIATIKQVLISPVPMAGFIVPEVCLLDPFAKFKDTSKIVAGASISGWLWNFGDVNANAGNPNTSTQQNPTHRYTAVGNYTVTLIAISNNGCRDTIQLPLAVNGGNPQADFEVAPGSYCSNDTVSVTNKSSITSGNITRLEIAWDNSSAVVENDDEPLLNEVYKHRYPPFQTPLTKIFSIRVRAYSGGVCFSDKIQRVTINATPKIQFDAVPDACLSEASYPVNQAFESSGLPGIGVYSGPGVSFSGGTYRISPVAAGVGTHRILYTFTTPAGCVDTASKQINVYANPLVNAGPDVFILAGGSTTLQPLVTGAQLQYLWLPNVNLSNNQSKNPVASPAVDITYSLKVTGAGQCTATDDVFVKVLQAPKIPNTFSPNNDGINDFWEIKYLDTYPNCKVQVFTRTGKLVFESRGYRKMWDGNANGKSLPVDTYYYIIEPENGRKPITGYITIIK